ncbi:PREDICTED: uncharacterized protein LOC107328434 [Acropora digitifera]|uniref:uncharacterized protein LOC107328434 n=1 Tax=Acropora digitifera TaxID=70779 RepID=UPI00077A10A6|nr:PREDICTED: uncharacterized protein LOC107328434 [Acropora digitifera]
MAAGMEKLFLFGEEFEAILDILEDDEELEDEFTATAKDAQSTNIVCIDCGKKCKSSGGYKRHRAAKHNNSNLTQKPLSILPRCNTLWVDYQFFSEIDREQVDLRL